MKQRLLLPGIIALGIFLRFWNLTTVPPSLSHDETAIAYNAYSILKTGKDEYGTPFPLLFRSFDDYKLPGMVYATVPFVALFGRSTLGARFPSALLGSLTILIIFLLVYELTKQTRFALSAAFFFAISPWHINFSRQLFESNGALFFLSFATYMLIVSLRNIRFLLLASLLFGLSVYFYYSVRLVIPFVILAYWVINKRQLIISKPTAIFSLFVFLAIVLPISRQMFTRGGLERISIVSLVNDSNYHTWKKTFINIYATKPTLGRKILFNQKTALLVTAIDNYWKNIAPLHVFASGTTTYGLQHPFEIPFIFIGSFIFITLPQQAKWLLIAWFFAAFLPGALSKDQPNALRTLLASPFLSIASGIGAVSLLRAIEPRKRVLLGFVPFSLLFIFFLYSFYHAYFIVNPTRNALSFGDGYEQMIRYVKTHEARYDRIVISGYFWRPYIFMLYWGGVDPFLYQREGTRGEWGKYVFTGAGWDKNEIFLYDSSFDPKTLVVASPDKTLFILGKVEYERNKTRYKYIDTIPGRHEPAVFVSATAN